MITAVVTLVIGIKNSQAEWGVIRLKSNTMI